MKDCWNQTAYSVFKERPICRSESRETQGPSLVSVRDGESRDNRNTLHSVCQPRNP